MKSEKQYYTEFLFRVIVMLTVFSTIMILSGCSMLPKHSKKKLECVEKMLDNGVGVEGARKACNYILEPVDEKPKFTPTVLSAVD